MTAMQAVILHVSINRAWQEVYAFAANPENIAAWAAGLASGLAREGDDWIGDGGPLGKLRVRFAPDNPFGVIDHTVTLDNGVSVTNALRVIPNGDGAEVMFALLKQPGMDDEAFDRDAQLVQNDLVTLKAIMES